MRMFDFQQSAHPNLFVLDIAKESAKYTERLPIDQWAEKNIMLPSNTAEPGKYSCDRAPYQRKPMQVMSPEDPTTQVTLCWGSQNGKTTIENNMMFYYSKEYPVPQAFGFSDDANLKNYIRNKFNPLLEANEQVKNILQAVGGKGSGNTMSTKIYPGGFIKFLSGKSEASLRSDSVMVFIADELDAWGITKGGDPETLIRKRTNTFGSRRKICLSSTPLNASIIFDILKKSTYNKFFLQCPTCGQWFTLEMDNFRWDKDENNRVTAAWFECPSCNAIVKNEDKVELLPKGEWRATNMAADPLHQGFYLPTFYAPPGWISWKDIAQEYVDAGTDYDSLTVFYNTILAMPYVVGANSNDWRLLYEQNLNSEYMRGKIPNWVNVLTTGSDVQGNRIETTLMGWGFRGRHIVIDHYVFPLEKDEDMEMLDNHAWTNYRESILNGEWIREDGFVMTSMANAIDRSYKSSTVSQFYISLSEPEKNICFPVRGYDRLTGFIPNMKFDRREGLRDAKFWDVPTNPLKRQIFDHLTMKDNESHTVAFLPFYPSDFDQEFYMQLFSESEIMQNKKLIWVKNRDRNEILDTHVYNYAMFYLCGFGGFKDEDWIGIADAQREQVQRAKNPANSVFTPKRRRISRGIEL